MQVDNVIEIIEQDIIVAKEDFPRIVDTNLLAFLIPYKCSYLSKEDVEMDNKTPVIKKVKLYITAEDV